MKRVGRILLVLLVLVTAIVLLYPTFRWYFLTSEEDKTLSQSSAEEIRETAQSKAAFDSKALKKMAKDNGDAPVPSEYKYLEKSAEESLFKRGKDKPKKWTISSLLLSFPSENEFFSAIEKHYRENIQSLKKLSSRVLNLGLDLRGGMSILLEADVETYNENHETPLSSQDIPSLISEDIEILQNRFDQFGVSEPDIRTQGNDQILIELPGESDPDRVNSFLRSSGALSFHLVDDTLTARVNEEYKKSPSSFFDDRGKIIKPEYIGEGRILLGQYQEDEYGLESMENLVVLYEEVALDGNHVQSAVVQSASQTNATPSIAFTLDLEGGNIFYAFTSSHTGEDLALVLNDKVKSVARINGAIRDNVQLTGSFTKEEANSLKVVLKSQLLPLELKIISQSSVGATLGDESVKTALKALFVGVLLVLIFMFIYYGLSGLVADFALLLNLIMMLSLLSAMSFTLTLASIAGIVLTLGMAIDANVIIYERMKEEKRLGKSGYDIVKTGFKRAFWTIMDSNVTTIIAGGVLIALGSSAIKGFAVTLVVGIVCSLFTSLFVSHLVFDLFITEDNKKEVNLSLFKKGERK